MNPTNLIFYLPADAVRSALRGGLVFSIPYSLFLQLDPGRNPVFAEGGPACAPQDGAAQMFQNFITFLLISN